RRRAARASRATVADRPRCRWSAGCPCSIHRPDWRDCHPRFSVHVLQVIGHPTTPNGGLHAMSDYEFEDDAAAEPLEDEEDDELELEDDSDLDDDADPWAKTSSGDDDL